MDQKTIACPNCGKMFNKHGIGHHIWRVHGEGVKFNPNANRRPAWNRGLTKDNSIIVARIAESHRRKRTDLEIELDDDGKLIEKWRNKCINARYAGHSCFLTFDEYCLLVKQAGLKSSQLGYKGENYVLARYDDQGDYTFNNCRFISQKENAKERKLSDKQRQQVPVVAEKLRKLHADPVFKAEFSAKVKLGLSRSVRAQERSKIAKEKEAERQKSLHPSYSGKRNSHYGHFWITNGTDNKSWSLENGDIPEGYYRGRVNGNKKSAPVV